jgi:hypothetical protein
VKLAHTLKVPVSVAHQLPKTTNASLGDVPKQFVGASLRMDADGIALQCLPQGECNSTVDLGMCAFGPGF